MANGERRPRTPHGEAVLESWSELRKAIHCLSARRDETIIVPGIFMTPRLGPVDHGGQPLVTPPHRHAVLTCRPLRGRALQPVDPPPPH